MRPRVPFVSNPFGEISRYKVVKTKPRSRLRNDDAQPSTCTYCLRDFFYQPIKAFVPGSFLDSSLVYRAPAGCMGLKGKKKEIF